MLQAHLDIIIPDKRWGELSHWEELFQKSILVAHQHALKNGIFAVPEKFEIAISLSDDKEVQGLNATFRGKDQPTNVLSFPEEEENDMTQLFPLSKEPVFLGNIIAAYETTSQEASLRKIDLKNHAIHLIVHGFLHLLGYNHVKNTDAEVMESLEADILGELEIENPYLADS